MVLDLAPGAAGTETLSQQGPAVICGEGLRAHSSQARLADVPDSAPK